MATPQMIQAARQAAYRVEQLLVEMLEAHQLGDVRVEVTPAGLQPFKHVVEAKPVIKTARGHAVELEHSQN